LKGIATIIATILLLIITISLVGTAYMFISGMLTSKIAKPISVLGSSCNSSRYITLVVSNDGTETIKEREIKIYIGSEFKGYFNKSIEPKDTNVTSDLLGDSDSNDVKLISPSNEVNIPVWC
jgi:FlaG/FlaF family flagellin (archaellin)